MIYSVEINAVEKNKGERKVRRVVGISDKVLQQFLTKKTTFE